MEIHGTSGDDELIGTSGDDVLRGGLGNDLLDGGSGDDLLDGGEGNDVLRAGPGSDVLDGGAGLHDTADYSGAAAGIGINLWWNMHSGGAAGDSLVGIEHVIASPWADTLVGNEFSNLLDGGAGNDALYGLSGDDVLLGGPGDDLLDGGSGGGDSASYAAAAGAVSASLAAGSATGAAGNDSLANIERLIGSGFADTLAGDDWDNMLSGEGGDDSLSAAGGSDLISGGAGDDTIDGGIGVDTVDYSGDGSASGVVVDLVTGAASGGAGNDVLVRIENVSGSKFDDTLTGNGGANFIEGHGGNDLLYGGGGRDSFVGGAGNDTIDGGAILDRTGSTDLNSVSYDSSASGVNVNLATGVAEDGLGGTDHLTNVNGVTGSRFADTIVGSSDPTLYEQFAGGPGDDFIDGGALDVVLQRNSNQASYAGANGPVSVDLGTGNVSGAAGADILVNINRLVGSSYADALFGSDGAMPEWFEGGAGGDTIDGKGGLDIVRYDSAITGVAVDLAAGTARDGLSGTDTLRGIEGVHGSRYNDVLTGSSGGLELFTGNAGNDTIDGAGGYDLADYSTSTSGVMVTLGGSQPGTAADGWGGLDVLISIEGVRGSAGHDWLTGSDSGPVETFEAGAGNDVIDGRGGLDIVDYRFAPGPVAVDLAAGTALDGHGTSDTLSNIEDVRGSTFGDVITGDRGANRIEAGAGDDTINGGAGFDVAVFSGLQSEYTIVRRGISVTVTGPDGTDSVSGVETLSFSDAELVLWGPGLHGKGGATIVGSWPDMLE